MHETKSPQTRGAGAYTVALVGGALAVILAFGAAPVAAQTLTIVNGFAVEGDTGTSEIHLTVDLSSPQLVPVSVDWTTEAIGTGPTAAQPGVDYVEASGTLVIPPLANMDYIAVLVIGDYDAEQTELFRVVLSNPQNAVLNNSFAVGVIQDDDARISIGNASVVEGDVGTSLASFAVSLDGTKGVAVSATWTAEEFPSTSAATADVDFVAESGVVTFSPGEDQTTIYVQVIGDTEWEPTETFRVVLSDPVHGSIAPSPGFGQIQNDDVRMSIGNASVVEGDAGTSFASFAVSLDGTKDVPVSATWTAEEFPTATAATADVDFVAESGVVAFDIGASQAVIDVQVIGDSEREPTETFRVVLSDPVNGSIHVGTGFGQIQNDDAGISVSNASVVEGDSGTTDLFFTISLSMQENTNVEVDYTTSPGTAAAGPDYQPVTGTALIPVGYTSAVVVVPVFGDTDYENDEILYLDLTNPVGASLVDSQGVGTILNDDAAPPVPALGATARLLLAATLMTIGPARRRSRSTA